MCNSRKHSKGLLGIVGAAKYKTHRIMTFGNTTQMCYISSQYCLLKE